MHFVGLSLLVGTDRDVRPAAARAREGRVDPRALHQARALGVFGYALNVITGAMFLVTEPNQYIYNPAFQFKLTFMAMVGLNILVFYGAAVRPPEAAPSRARTRRAVPKTVAIVSLMCLDRRDRLRPAADVLPARRLRSQGRGLHRDLHSSRAPLNRLWLRASVTTGKRDEPVFRRDEATESHGELRHGDQKTTAPPPAFFANLIFQSGRICQQNSPGTNRRCR